MAQFQYQQGKGTLVPGQTITINKFNVQIERYLAQGGFAHVYLVRTATPVYNTTHHVLKRIAVANEAMLSEVKKEVDVMRLLKGHPNIVHLIDAAWHRMSNGLYEVFILMEFCPGGGIIDMMNRRLRERLTEAEILQIFVDVCEGVAYMHNLRPPLLHRDLKVENILQASPTSFKLCDFGSACAVAPKPPATTQEIRALEADLNRHTTLQYRAPEMVDPYMRRPVDEKSDVWALGVLLYKLCYYTTPFEEHGPLAILNVQYRIPPYPVYSSQMNTLIASMLREHGAHRPTVFELLAQVHQLRGTKSQFQYNIPASAPLSPRQPKPVPSIDKQPRPSPQQPLAMSVTMTKATVPSVSPTLSPAKTPGVQAREKVLEAIEPMRRGRPTPAKEPSSYSRPSSPQKQTKPSQGTANSNDWLKANFDADSDKAWKAATSNSEKTKPSLDEAWSLGSAENPKSDSKKAFGDDFGGKLWDSFAPSSRSTAELLPTSTALPSLPSKSTTTPARPSTFTGPALHRKSSLVLPSKDRDAFDGLGLVCPPSEKPPTLAEARKLRTGLAVMHSNTDRRIESNKLAVPSKPAPSPTNRSHSPSPAVPLLQPSSSGSSWSSQPPPSRSHSSLQVDGLPVETRYPSLEELDARFASPTVGQQTPGRPKPSPTPTPVSKLDSSTSTSGPYQSLKPPLGNTTISTTRSSIPESSPQRPSLSRKHRSSVTIKQTPPLGSDIDAAHQTRPPILPHQPAKDWLTGDDESDDNTPMQSLSRKHDLTMRDEVKKSETQNRHVEQIQSSPNQSSPTVERFTRAFPALEHGHGDSKEPDSASSADEGPEDVNGFTPSSLQKSSEVARPRRKGRQSSVHDLVDLWGGGVGSSSARDQPVRSTVTPVSYKPGSTDTKQHKRRSTALPAISTAKSTTSHNPQSTLSPPDSAKSSGASSGKLTPNAVSPSRSRPQSMFMFPSKSPDVGSFPAASPNLVSEEPRPRAVRRTSISDMVQRYEAIEASSKSGPSNLSVPPEDLRPRTSPTSSSQASGRSLLQKPDDTPIASKSTRTSPVGASRQAEDGNKDSTPRPRRISVRPEPSVLKSSDDSSRQVEPRSPSPERPYQGVGKLIDQWQRKAEESTRNSVVPKRGGGMVAKRVGLVNAGTGGGQ